MKWILGPRWGWTLRNARRALYAILVVAMVSCAGLGRGAPVPKAEPVGERTVEFPSDRSIGTIRIRPWDTAVSHAMVVDGKWTDLGEAHGPITIPAGQWAKLILATPKDSIDALATLEPHTIQGLELKRSDVTDEDLAQLPLLPGLLMLDLYRTSIGDESLAHIKDLPDLEWLRIGKTAVTGPGLAHLRSMATLRFLDVYDLPIADADLKHLKKLRGLEELRIDNTRLTDAAVPALAALPSLRKVELPRRISGTALARFNEALFLQVPDLGKHFAMRFIDTDTGEGLENVRVDVRVDNKVKQYMTLSGPDGACDLSVPPEDIKYLIISANAPDYVPMRVTWRTRDGDEIPDSYTLSIPKGTTIGGLIKNETGQPVTGVQVSLLVPSDGDGRERIAISDYVVETDDSGKWACHVVPAKLDDIWIQLAHPDYVSDNMYGATPRPSIEGLRAGTGVMILKQGLRVVGLVTDEQGRPIAGARVKQGADRWGSDYPDTQTDEEGRFAFANSDPGETVLTVEHQDYAPELVQVNVFKSLEDLEITLGRGQSVRGRVVDASGNPIEGAIVVADTWKGFRSISWRAETDRKGRFEWPNAPADAVQYDIRGQGYMSVRNKALAPGEQEHEITLFRPLKIAGSVTDAVTGKPIDAFRAIPGIDWGNKRLYWQLRDTKEFQDGHYELSFDHPYPGHLVRIEADGYLPAFSRAFSSNEEDQVFDFALEKGTSIAGIVRDPHGVPIPDAKVYLCTPSQGVYLQNGRPANIRDITNAVTDAEGRFAFPPQVDPYALVIAEDAGYAEVAQKEFEVTQDIKLQAWARVEGTLYIRTELGKGRPVMLSYDRAWDPNAPRVNIHYSQTAGAADGRFVFERAIPGEAWLYRGVNYGRQTVAYSHGHFIEAESGETVHVTMGGTGRPVLGKVMVPDAIREVVSWNVGSFRITLKQPDPPKPEGSENWSPEEAQAWYKQWQASEKGKAHKRARRSYAFKVMDDGSFRVDDVLPGTYALAIAVHEPPPANQCGWRELIAKAGLDFEIPLMETERSDDPFDIGTVNLKEIMRLQVGDRVPGFAIETLDGEPLNLDDFLGKFVLLGFWATWCGQCRAETPTLEEAYDRFKNLGNFVMIGLSLDTAVEAPKKYVEENELGWIQGFLGEWSKTSIPEEYGVQRIPATMLVDPEGRLVAKDLRGTRIVEAVTAALP